MGLVPAQPKCALRPRSAPSLCALAVGEIAILLVYSVLYTPEENTCSREGMQQSGRLADSQTACAHPANCRCRPPKPGLLT